MNPAARQPISSGSSLDGAVRGLEDEIKLHAGGSASAEESSRGCRWRQGDGRGCECLDVRVELGVADWGGEDVEGAAKLQLHVYVRN